MSIPPTVTHPSATGGVRWLLRLEGLVVLAVALLGYHHLHTGWTQFFVLFFLPDVSFLGYLAGPRVGALTYNTMHTYASPLILVLLLFLTHSMEWAPFALIWIAHIGFDRMAGYGLKYGSGFRDTHLGPIGKQPTP